MAHLLRRMQNEKGDSGIVFDMVSLDCTDEDIPRQGNTVAAFRTMDAKSCSNERGEKTKFVYKSALICRAFAFRT